MPQGVEMIFFRKSNGLVDFPQALGKRIRMNELPMGIREEIGTEFPMRLPGLHLLPAAVTHEDPPEVGGEDDLTAAAILGWSLHDTFSRDNAAERLMVRRRPSPLNLKSDQRRAHNSPRRQPVHMESR